MNTQQLVLQPDDFKRLNNLCGVLNANIDLLEKHLNININNLGNKFTISGKESAVNRAIKILQKLHKQTQTKTISPNLISQELVSKHDFNNKVILKTPEKVIKPRNTNQNAFLTNIQSNEVNFGIGVAGTGKTYLAVASAVNAFTQKQIERIILVRPAVEAGEKLGFLPGDLAEKVDPYLRPLYDALFEMMGNTQVEKLISKKLIEVAPLAFMRGRTLNNSFIILDEAQNTTVEQMKMFLTRLGFGSTAIINGDITQIDLAVEIKSGLVDAIEKLANIRGIHFTFFQPEDIVRHPLVQDIVNAYENNS